MFPVEDRLCCCRHYLSQVATCLSRSATRSLSSLPMVIHFFVRQCLYWSSISSCLVVSFSNEEFVSAYYGLVVIKSAVSIRKWRHNCLRYLRSDCRQFRRFPLVLRCPTWTSCHSRSFVFSSLSSLVFGESSSNCVLRRKLSVSHTPLPRFSEENV